MKERERVTLADVAREAGVSAQTVSRVVNQKSEVSPETRARILEIIERLNYRPNRVAQALARQRTRVVGVIVPDITSPFYADLVRGVEDVAHRQDYRVFLCNIAESAAREQAAIASLEDHNVDGIILAGSRLSDEALSEIVQRNPNIVLFNRQLPVAHTYVVRNNDQRAACMATRYLLEKGHRTICYMGGQQNSFSRRERIVGYRHALEAAGVPFDAGLLFEGYPYLDVGRKLIQQILHIRPDVTAVLAYNDLMAIGALRFLAETGRRDVAMVGVDDIMMASLVSPALTTVRQLKCKAGVAIMQMMLRCLLKEDTSSEDCTSHEVILEPELVVRESA